MIIIAYSGKARGLKEYLANAEKFEHKFKVLGVSNQVKRAMKAYAQSSLIAGRRTK